MKTTKPFDNDVNAIAVNTDTLARKLNCGRATAVKIGTEAGAKFCVGRRVLFDISKVKEYIAKLSEENNT